VEPGAVSLFLGVDGGGTKTDFVLVNDAGRVLASHRAGSAYYLETGIDALRAMLVAGIQATLQRGGVPASQVDFAFIGLPSHGEDSALLPRLDGIAADVLPALRHRCGNDMVCGWAGALAGEGGINLVAGTGAIAYGEFAGRAARAGGWGELFSDEGSAYWIACEGLRLFSRMSDGRAARGPLYPLMRDHFHLRGDLDLCAAVYGPPAMARSELAGLAPLIARAAMDCDTLAQRVFEAGAQELASLVHAVSDALQPPPGTPLPVSYSGGMFRFGDLILGPLRAALGSTAREYEFAAPKLTPSAGAALYAAKLNGTPLTASAIAEFARQCAAGAAAEVSA
jgi:N-acetylglucosamine kinase-like BadF-type ATPase